jgi:hypothetical protein
MQKKPESGGAAAKAEGRKPYAKPRLTRYGAVHALTRAGATSKSEGNPTQKKTGGSDVRLKERVVRVGTHPAGFGLYLFDYAARFRERHGHGRQFGVMADEVARVNPEAVSVDADGYLAVDYAALGIDR